MRRFRFDQAFHLVNADNFLKNLFSSDVVTKSIAPLQIIDGCQDVDFKQMTCTVVNMNYFDFLEKMGIVNNYNGEVQGCMDEYLDEMTLSDKLRTGLLWEEDENFETLQEDKYQNEFIFKLFSWLAIGGGCCQHDVAMETYLTATRDLYKDLITVAKDEQTSEIKPMSHVFRINQIKSSKDLNLGGATNHK